MSVNSHPFETADNPGPRWPLRQHALIAGLLVIVELSWLLPWFFLIIQSRSDVAFVPTALTFGAITSSTLFLTLFLERLYLIDRVHNGLLLAWFAVCLWGAWRFVFRQPGQSIVASLLTLESGALFVFLTVLWLWWRGVKLAGVDHPETVWRRFSQGLLIFMAYIFVSGWMDSDNPGLGWFLVMLFAGFLALIVARVVDVSRKSTGRRPFGGRWLAGMAVVLGLIVTLAAVFGGLLTGQLTLVLDLAASAVRFFISALLFVFALPAVILAALVGGLMAWLRRFLGGSDSPIPETPEMDLLPFDLQEPPAPQGLPPYLFPAIFWGLILLVLVWLYLRLRKQVRLQRLPELGDPESLLEPGEARKLLRKAIQDAWQDFSGRLRPKSHPLPESRVRQIYIELLDLFQELGLIRPIATTPLEFLPEMGDHFPAVQVDLDTITRAYLRVRYGELIASESEIEEVERAWQRILDLRTKMRPWVEPLPHQ